MSFSIGGVSFSSHSGSAPSPFDALDGPRLAGPQGSHPLHDVHPEELVKPVSGAVTGSFTFDHPARVGDGITGRLTLTATGAITARSANLRLIGLRLQEETRSLEHRDSQGRVTSTEHWVEVHGNLFETSAFTEPVIPATLAAGQTFETTFAIPAPRLGPPSAHLGEAIIAWALEVRWDIAMRGDAHLATLLPIAQHPDLLAAGVGEQGGMSMMQAISTGGATISISSPLPAMAGSTLAVGVTWPSAPSGPARIELHRRSNAPNGVNAIVATTSLDAAELQSGSARAEFALPAGTSPSFDGAGLRLLYVVRVLVSRRFRPDTAVERPVAIA